MRPIDADGLLKDIEELKKSPWYNGENGNYERLIRSEAIGLVVDLCIKGAPTLHCAPVKRGLFGFVGGSAISVYVNFGSCSECKERVAWYQHKNYCPNCGARMDGGEKRC